MNTLIIGGTGFIGSQIAGRLAQRGHRVTIFHRGSTKTDFPEIIGDKANLEAFRSDFARLKPDAVIDVVNYTRQEAEKLVNVFRGIAGKAVVLSSQDVYRAFAIVQKKETGREALPVGEQAPLRRETFYYRDYAEDENDLTYNYSKLLVEEILLGEPDLPATILRLPCVYGVGDHKHRFYPYIRRMDDQRPFILVDESEAGWRWTRGYVENVAEAVALASEPNDRSVDQIYNVGEKEAVSVREWIKLFGAEIGWDGKIITVPVEKSARLDSGETEYSQDFIADTEKIRRDLKFTEIVSRPIAIKRTIDWERTQPPDKIEPDLDYATENEIYEELRH